MVFNMDKFRCILEYAAESKVEDGNDGGKTSGELQVEDLSRIVTTYVEAEGSVEKEVETACKALFNLAGKPKLRVIDILDELQKEGNAVAELLSKLKPDGESQNDQEERKDSLLKKIYEDDQQEDSEEEEEVMKEKPLLRGTVKLVEGILTWTGKWAMSAEKFSTGEKSRFKYTFSGKDVNDNPVGQPKTIMPMSGKYSGSFMLLDPSAQGGQVKIEEPEVCLNFKQLDEGSKMYDVEGKGKNSFGSFKLVGKFDPERSRLAVEKEYQSIEDEDFQEFSDGDDGDEEIENEAGVTNYKQELQALREEANLPVEELRRRYTDQEVESSKRAKLE